MAKENSNITQGTVYRNAVEKFYAKFRLVSLDVVAGAVGSGLMLTSFLRMETSWPFLVVLGLAVWLIYTLDHLLDARRLKVQASTDRHRFHHNHFTSISLIWLLLAGLCLWLALSFLSVKVIWFGFGMSGITLFHLALVKWIGDKTSPFLIKEMGVALVYSFGIWGLPILETETWTHPGVWLALGQFFLLALTNLLEFSWYEYDTDAQDGQTSFVLAIGKHKSRNFILFLILLFFVSTPVQLVLFPSELMYGLQGIYAMIGVVLFGLWAWPTWFAVHERYRAWGDGAFLLPFFTLILMPFP